MKTYTCVLFLILLALTPYAEAQHAMSSIGKGFKGGVGISDVAYHEKATGIKTAYLIGGLFSYRQSDWFSFQVEALYTSKGYTLSNVEILYQDGNETDTAFADAEIILGYLEFPLVGKFTAPLEGKYRPYVLGGGFMGLSVVGKSRFTGRLIAIDTDIDNTETVDLGAVVAVGIDIKLSNGWLFFESRFDSSLLPAIKTKEQKSQVLFFQLGYWW